MITGKFIIVRPSEQVNSASKTFKSEIKLQINAVKYIW